MRQTRWMLKSIPAAGVLLATALAAGCFLLPNEPPVAAFTATPSEGAAPLSVGFDASDSYDPDGNLKAYRWAFGDGATGSGVQATHVYVTAGSYTATLTVEDLRQGSDAASEEILVRSGVKRAIIVGIAAYPPPMPQLTYTDDDAMAMRDRLASLPGWEDGHIVLLTNQQATLNSFRIALEAMGGASPDDTLVIFFSGHGNYYQDANGDEADGYDEALEFYDQPLLDDTLPLLLEQVAMRRVAVFIDACFSGGQLDSRDARGARGQAFLDDLSRARAQGPQDLDRLAKELVAVTASRSDEYSWELATLRHGVFTYALLEALDGRADVAGDGDGQTSAEETYAYLGPRVRSLAAAAGAIETPQMLDLCPGDLEIAGCP